MRPNLYRLLNKYEQKQKINFSVVGFGSKAYPDFCGYAHDIDILLAKQNWAERILELQTVNDKSAEEFVNWIKLWSAKTGIPFPLLHHYTIMFQKVCKN